MFRQLVMRNRMGPYHGSGTGFPGCCSIQRLMAVVVAAAAQIVTATSLMGRERRKETLNSLDIRLAVDLISAALRPLINRSL